MKKIVVNSVRSMVNKFKFKNSIILTPYVIGSCKLGYKSALNREVIFENSTLGDYSYVNRSTIVVNTEIGKYCSISYNCVIGAKEHDMRNISTSPLFEMKDRGNKKTVINDDVWIGANVVIKAGITIGRGAVIGAGSIVVKNVEPYAIYTGIPAKFLKSRLDYFDTDKKKFVTNIKFTEELSTLLEYNEKLRK